MLSRLNRVFVHHLSVLAFVGITACSQEGPMERAGKKVDEAVEDAGEAIEDTQEKVEDAIEEKQKQ